MLILATLQHRRDAMTCLVSIFPFVSVQVPLEHHSVSAEFQGEKDGFSASTEPFCQRSDRHCATLNRDEERSEMSDCFATSIINSGEKLCHLLIRISKWVFTCRSRLMRYMICSFLPFFCYSCAFVMMKIEGKKEREGQTLPWWCAMNGFVYSTVAQSNIQFNIQVQRL